ncbi:hypothetical protein TNCV_428861 [Trichonephila clavipes]|nr:hypothetical protein TNCV_428861 [Trichonephila clavipes]
MALYRSPLTVTLWPSSFLKKYGPMIPPAHKAHKTGQGWNPGEGMDVCKCIVSLRHDGDSKLPSSRKPSRQVGGRRIEVGGS